MDRYTNVLGWTSVICSKSRSPDISFRKVVINELVIALVVNILSKSEPNIGRTACGGSIKAFVDAMKTGISIDNI